MSYWDHVLLTPLWRGRWIDRALRVEPANLIALWPLDDKAGTVARSITRRSPNILLNGGFETAGAGGADVFAEWKESAGDGAVARTTAAGEFRSGTAACKLTGGNTPIASPVITQDISVVPGAAYTLSFWTRGDGANAGRYRVRDQSAGVDILGTTSTRVTGETHTQIVYSFTAPVGCTTIRLLFYCPNVAGGVAYFDDVELLAPPHTNPFDGQIVAADLAQPGIGDGSTAMSFDGANDYINIWSPALKNTFNPTEGALLVWLRMANTGVWTDGTTRRIVVLEAADAANNALRISKSSTHNRLVAQHLAGGTSLIVNIDSMETLSWLSLVLTWSLSKNEVRLFCDGTQIGATQTGVGTWASTFIGGRMLIGAGSTTPANSWHGSIGPVALWDKALSQAQIAYLSRVP